MNKLQSQPNTNRFTLSSQCLAIGVIVFVLAFGIRLGLVWKFVGLNSPPDAMSAPDQLDYEESAFQLSIGNGYANRNGEPTLHRMPGTSFTLLPVYMVFGRSYAAARIWFCILSSFACVGTTWVASQSFGKQVGLVAGLLIAVFPNHAYGPLHFVSEVPFSLFVILATGTTVLAFRRECSVRMCLIAGILWGCTALVRPNILLCFPFLIGYATWSSPRFTRGLYRSFCVTAVACLLVGCWAGRNDKVFGRPTLAAVGAYTFWGANNERALLEIPGSWIRTSELVNEGHPLDGSELNRMDQANQYAKNFLHTHLADLPYLTTMKFYRLLGPWVETDNVLVQWSFGLAWLAVLPFVVFGVCQALSISKTDSIYLLMPLAAIALTAAIFYGSPRFRDSVSSVYLVFAALGLQETASRLNLQRRI